MTDCIHLKAGTQRTFTVWRSWHLCLDCAHDLYERDKIPGLAGIYMHVEGARKDKRIKPERTLEIVR